MAKVQKVYTREFKEEAVRLAQTSGKPITQVARELSISDTSIHQWHKELAQHGKDAFPGSGHQTAVEEENRRLKRELERVQMKYQFIEQYKQEFPVVVMCNVLGVSESGYYTWRKRPTCQRQREDAQLTQEIRQVFMTHQGRYGCPRIHRELRDQGRSCSRKRIARLMRKAALHAGRKRRRVLTTRRDPSHPVAPNLLKRDFTATEPNQKWVTDITYIPTIQGWLYLAVILDLYSRAVVGWSMSAHCDEELAENALHMAVVRRRPKAGLLHHSDRGSQYTSKIYQRRLEHSAMIVSMSRKGNCWDHAAMESFFGSLKEECVGNTIYPSHEQARQSLFEYLEIYYNRQRRHSTLGYVSPLMYEQMGIQQLKRNV
jgi:putative transposase